MERIKFYSDRVWISEQDKDPEILTLRILISTFEPNLNGVLLNRATIDTWLDTILTKPLVAKIAYKTDKSGKSQIADFTGHNISVETYIDESGLEQERVVFDTQAFGTIVSASIEDIDGKEGIVVVAHVWRRYYTATEIIERRIKEGNLHTSWEISVLDYERKIIGGQLVKVINRGIFSADTMLGNAYPPAFPTARILDVASDENDAELCDALIQDTMSLNKNPQGNEVEEMDKIENPIDTSAEEVNTGGVEIGKEEGEETPASDEETRTAEEQAEKEVETKPEKAELTMRDLRWKIEEALYKFADKYLDVVFIFPESHMGWAHDWSENETDMHEFTYTVENDEVSISGLTAVTLIVSPREINSAMEEKASALIKAQKQINDLTAQVELLSPYKEAAETAAREKAEAKRKESVAELRAYAEESGMVTKEELSSGEIAEMIEALKETDLKVLISDRIVAKQKGAKPTEIASVKKQMKVRTDISSAATDDTYTIFRSTVFGK